MNKRDLSNTSLAFHLGSTTFFCVIILSTQYQFKYEHYYSYTLLLYILRTYIYIIFFCIVYSLYQFVNEKVENKIKSNQNQINNNYFEETGQVGLSAGIKVNYTVVYEDAPK